MFVLAVDPLVVTDLVIGTVTIGVTVGLFWLSARTAKLERLENDVETKNEKLVAQQLLSHTNPLKTSIDALTREIAGIHKRLDEGDGDFKDIANNRLSMSVQLEKRFGDLKTFMAETFASRDDLKDHEKSVSEKFQQVTRETADIGKQVAVLSDRMGK
jgi:septal ring factor EnvC (AmiA/AmiB activator)